MDGFSAAVLALGVSMDAFAVSICKGLACPRAGGRAMAACGLWFGGAQALMTGIGWSLGAVFAGAVAKFDGYASFFLLELLGVNLIAESFSADDPAQTGGFSAAAMAPAALATSVDALAAGVSLALSAPGGIGPAAALIGTVTAAVSAAGVRLGSFFGRRLEHKARIAGGSLLIGLGIRMLFSHCGGF